MKKQPKLTDWIDPEIKPTIKGWYEREYLCNWMGKMHDYWDGKHWYVGNGAGAKTHAMTKKRWRGLAQDPAKVKG